MSSVIARARISDNAAAVDMSDVIRPSVSPPSARFQAEDQSGARAATNRTVSDDQASSGAPRSGDERPAAAGTAEEEPQVFSPSAAEVAEALAALEPGERDLILDAYLGASYREIAANRGLSETTVKSTIRRGLTRIVAIIRKFRTVAVV